MLKITTEHQDDGVLLKIEGDLAGTEVQVLEEFWSTARPSFAGRSVRIDLSGVSRVDDAGRYLLALVHHEGARMESTGVETNALLASIARDWPLDRPGAQAPGAVPAPRESRR